MTAADTKNSQNNPAQETDTNLQTVVVRREPERDLVVWNAPGRLFRKRDKQYFVTIFAIVGIISLIVFIAEGLMPVLLLVALVFLYYILSTVKPDEVEYKVTSKGIKIAGRLTEWQIIERFWFTTKGEHEAMVVDTFLLPGRLELVINPEIKETLKKEMSAYVPFEEAPSTSLDKLTNWIGQKLPGNN